MVQTGNTSHAVIGAGAATKGLLVALESLSPLRGSLEGVWMSHPGMELTKYGAHSSPPPQETDPVGVSR